MMEGEVWVGDRETLPALPGTRGDSGASPHFRGSSGCTCEGTLLNKATARNRSRTLGLDDLGLNHNVPTF